MQVCSFSIVIGGTKCNAACPCCVARMSGAPRRALNPDWCGLRKAIQAAKDADAWSVILTGKGEPTEYPELLTRYLQKMGDISEHLGYCRPSLWNKIRYQLGMSSYDRLPFAFVDLQTNGINIPNQIKLMKLWKRLGLNTVCLSLHHWDSKINAKMMRHAEHGMDIWKCVEILQDIGFLVRLNFTAMKGGVASLADVDRVMDLCRDTRVDQLTIRDVATPDEKVTRNPEITKQVRETQVFLDAKLRKYMEEVGASPILSLSHGATVFVHDGQSLCVNNCLTQDDKDDHLRQIINWPDGTNTPDWVYDFRLL